MCDILKLVLENLSQKEPLLPAAVEGDNYGVAWVYLLYLKRARLLSKLKSVDFSVGFNPAKVPLLIAFLPPSIEDLRFVYGAALAKGRRGQRVQPRLQRAFRGLLEEKGLPHLKSLQWNSARLDGSALKCFTPLLPSSLEILNLCNNLKVRETGWKALSDHMQRGGFPNLRILDLSYCSLDQPGSLRSGRLLFCTLPMTLEVLHVDGNSGLNEGSLWALWNRLQSTRLKTLTMDAPYVCDWTWQHLPPNLQTLSLLAQQGARCNPHRFAGPCMCRCGGGRLRMPVRWEFLKTLELPMCDVTDEAMCRLFERARFCSLEGLVLRGNWGVSAVGWRALGGAMCDGRVDKLKFLEVDDCAIDPEGAEALFPCLRPPLESLNLKNNREKGHAVSVRSSIKPEGWHFLGQRMGARGLDGLRRLSVDRCDLTSDCVVQFFPFLPSSLEILELGDDPRRSLRIGPTGWRSLGQRMKSGGMDKLKLLDVSFCDVTPGMARLFVPFLPATLEDLLLGGNFDCLSFPSHRFNHGGNNNNNNQGGEGEGVQQPEGGWGDDGEFDSDSEFGEDESVVESVSAADSGDGALVTLAAGGEGNGAGPPSPLTEAEGANEGREGEEGERQKKIPIPPVLQPMAAGRWNRLRVLDVHSLKLCPDTSASLFSILPPSLEAVNLMANRFVGAKGWGVLATRMGEGGLPVLKRLTCAFCDLIDSEAVPLFRALPSSLESLDLHGNDLVGLPGWESLGERLGKQGGMRDLTLSGCNLDGQKAMAIFRGLPSSLAKLDLSHNRKINMEGWDSLGGRVRRGDVPRLEDLWVVDCHLSVSQVRTRLFPNTSVSVHLYRPMPDTFVSSDSDRGSVASSDGNSDSFGGSSQSSEMDSESDFGSEEEQMISEVESVAGSASPQSSGAGE
uniref:Uncharacterized protein n=1 Tax=Chromera velia CCMP2878 TaxID=1169474 RepID=A0A0G4IEU2_9ALVE|eukprot:Cvel_2433.t1-p1 / transcript=Cvel_2433.t1 / gene=Cvel_2433 / organism=Chromera_velia_CCMP2878 / gene_product=hypothetical protein / transcript_product=hypothetical protein / location=Cvel_scaffold95:79700-82601(+) / protein_length=901 / sequence_SO=supercontig / SO=protein_coding / is_pseudo=false